MRNEKLTIFIGAEKLRLVKRYKTSISEFKRILELDFEDAGVRDKIGDVYVEWSKIPEAMQEYNDAVTFYLKQEDREKAIKCLQKMLKNTSQDDEDTGKEIQARIEVIEEEIRQVAEEAKRKEEAAKQDEVEAKLQKDFETVGSPLFRDCSVDVLSAVAKTSKIVDLPKGEVLFRQGDSGDSLYIIDKGIMEVVVSKKSGEKESDEFIPEETDTPLVELSSGDFFGEISFLAGSKRTATLIAKEDTRLFELSRDGFREVLVEYPQIEDSLLEYYKIRVLDLILAKSQLFSFLDKDQRAELGNYFVLSKYNKGEVILEEGSESRDLYLIKYGIVKVVTTDPSGKQVILTKLHAHAFFGEVSFLTGNPRTANVIAATPVELLVFTSDNLASIVEKYPRIRDIMKNFQKNRAFQTIKKFKMV